MLITLPFTLPELRAAYAAGTTPADVVSEVYRRIEEVNDPALFLHLRPEDEVLAEVDGLATQSPDLPLWGIPFVVKDNIDVGGIPTTAACPDFTYTPDEDAFVVKQLRAAGALLIGKTNLDQFATGLVGVRSPFGVPRNSVDPSWVPGGSSSGSGVAVGHGLVAFSLGTDTAGSGRVPAALNNIVGLKPSLGALSATGMVPACRTLDTISIFALSVSDAHAVFQVAAVFDPEDAYAKEMPATATAPLGPLPSAPKIGVPTERTREFFGDDAQARMFDAAVSELNRAGAEIIELDFGAFYDVAAMLYEGAWVAERYAAVEPLMRDTPEALHPTTRQIIGGAEKLSAADAFRGIYRLQDLKRDTDALLAQVDLLCVPTIPTFYSLADLEADPITPNSNFGTYTNFVNLLDLCGIAVPTGPRSDGRPGSVTLLAPSGEDAKAASVARVFEGRAALVDDTQVADGEMLLAVCGAHMSGLPLNHQLTSRGGRLVRATRSSANYRLYALAGGPPYRPGMVRTDGGAAIELEVWALPQDTVGSFLLGIPAPLGLGSVSLEDGSTVHGFICEASGTNGAVDITPFGGWRAYLDSQTVSAAQ
ncbi:MAG: allophanate hydrolase [Pseudomonadota bacterium]